MVGHVVALHQGKTITEASEAFLAREDVRRLGKTNLLIRRGHAPAARRQAGIPTGLLHVHRPRAPEVHWERSPPPCSPAATAALAAFALLTWRDPQQAAGRPERTARRVHQPHPLRVGIPRGDHRLGRDDAHRWLKPVTCPEVPGTRHRSTPSSTPKQHATSASASRQASLELDVAGPSESAGDVRVLGR